MILKNLAILVIIAILGFFSYKEYTKKNNYNAETTPEASLETISGTLLYTLSFNPKHTTDIFTFNLKTGEEKKILEKDDTNIKFTPSMSPDGKHYAFLSAPYDFTSKLYFPYTRNLSLKILDSSTGEIEEILASSSTLSFRDRKPNWSPDGRYILYHGYGFKAWEKSIPIKEPDSWNIYLYDTETKKIEIVANGMEAIWNSDGSGFYYLKNDGIHFRNQSTLDDVLVKEVLSVSGTNQNPRADMSMSLGLSPDGKTLAWATPHAYEFTLYRIEKDTPTSLRKIIRLQTGTSRVFNPVFSPDSKFLVVQESEFEKAETDSNSDSSDQLYLPQWTLINPRITVYELESFRSKKIKDLGPVDFFGTSINQWVK